jgi:hypothetical protein
VALFFESAHGVWMHLDAGAIQTKVFDADRNQALPLKRLENPLQDALASPTAKPRVDGVPIAVFLRQAAPFAAVLRNIEQCVQKSPVVDLHVAALHGVRIHFGLRILFQ